MSGKGYYYQILAKESLDDDRENRQELFIAGCRKNRMISFHPSGKFQTKRHICSCEECCLGNFELCIQDVEVHHYELDDDELDNLDEMDLVPSIVDERYEFIEPGSYAALFSTPNSFEPFIMFEVRNKSIAKDDIVDFYGHIAKKGEKYITGIYLEKKDGQNITKIFYKKHKKDVYINPGEVFCPVVSIMKMIYQCQFLTINSFVTQFEAK